MTGIINCRELNSSSFKPHRSVTMADRQTDRHHGASQQNRIHQGGGGVKERWSGKGVELERAISTPSHASDLSGVVGAVHVGSIGSASVNNDMTSELWVTEYCSLLCSDYRTLHR